MEFAVTPTTDIWQGDTWSLVDVVVKSGQDRSSSVDDNMFVFNQE